MRKRWARKIAVLALAHALAACGARTEPDDAPVDGSLDVSIDATVHAYVDASDGSDASDVISEVSGDARVDAHVDADGGSSTLCGRPCPRTTCADSAAVCGPIPDGCGGLLDCSGCPSDRPICLTSVCAETPPPCAPRTCAEWGFRCGLALDGCGGILSCGACPSGETCGAVTEGRCDPCPTALDAAPEIGGDSARESEPRRCRGGRVIVPEGRARLEVVEYEGKFTDSGSA